MYGENPFLIVNNKPFLLSCQSLIQKNRGGRNSYEPLSPSNLQIKILLWQLTVCFYNLP